MSASIPDNLVPCLVPAEVASAVAATVGCPILVFDSLPVGLAWVILHGPGSMVYVARDRARAWAAQDWRDVALDNLIERTESVWTQELRDGEDRLYAVILQR
jgi:hypothetical protein